MKKEELITAVRNVRASLKSDWITQGYKTAWNAQTSNQQVDFARNVMANLVEGIANFRMFTKAESEICDLLQISTYYAPETNPEILHHVAQSRSKHPNINNPGDVYRDNYLRDTKTLSFVEAHRRIVAISDLLDKMLHAERPEGELLLEGINAEGGPSLERVQEVLATVNELVTAYSESQGDTEKPRVEITYLDLGSNYQIGIKVDGKAEVGINLARLLTEIFRWLTNPRAYMRERSTAGITKEIAVMADLQKRIDAGELTVETAQCFAERLLGCGQKLAKQRVFPAGLFREQTVTSPAVELVKLMDEATQPPALLAPEFAPISSETFPDSEPES